MKKSKWLTLYFIKYTASGVISAVVEVVAWFLLTELLRFVTTGLLVEYIPMVVAKVGSYLQNFFVNQKLVFKSPGKTGPALLRYCLQAAPLVVMQIVLTSWGYKLFCLGEDQVVLRGILYILVMMSSFFISFLVQKFWVFPQKSRKKGGEGA